MSKLFNFLKNNKDQRIGIEPSSGREKSSRKWWRFEINFKETRKFIDIHLFFFLNFIYWLYIVLNFPFEPLLDILFVGFFTSNNSRIPQNKRAFQSRPYNWFWKEKKRINIQVYYIKKTK
mgnify:CR=1 FL=1